MIGLGVGKCRCFKAKSGASACVYAVVFWLYVWGKSIRPVCRTLAAFLPEFALELFNSKSNNIYKLIQIK